MLQRPRSITSQDQEHRRARHRYQVEGKKDDELGDLSEGKGRVDGRHGGLAELLYRVFAIGVENARSRDQVFVALLDEDGVEDVNEGFVDEEGFEDCCISLGQFFSFRGEHGSTETMSRCSRSALNKEIVGWRSPTKGDDGGPFTKDEKGGIEPRQVAVEDC